jgi:anti-sigma regulatory factor (Ser/Thr protein kinase)
MKLPGDLQAPAAARAFVADCLAKAKRPPKVEVDDVVLVTSELVTNAVRAGATKVDVDVLATSRRVDLVVEDNARGWPKKVRPGTDATSGRGLGIVEQLADSWTVDPQARGKRIVATWFA